MFRQVEQCIDLRCGQRFPVPGMGSSLVWVIRVPSLERNVL